MDKLVTAGSKWYMVSIKWIDKWQKYTYFDLLTGSEESQEERHHPGKITNSDILIKFPSGTILTDMAKGKEWQNN